MPASPPSADAALALSLSALSDAFLELRCPCKPSITVYPIRLLLRRSGDMQLRALLGRLRCQRCGGPPSPVRLCETAERGHGRAGAPSGWTIELVAGDGWQRRDG